MQKKQKITETLANGYSSERTRRELSNEYQDDRVSMVFQESCILVLWTKVVSALEGLSQSLAVTKCTSCTLITGLPLCLKSGGNDLRQRNVQLIISELCHWVLMKYKMVMIFIKSNSGCHKMYF